MKHYQRNPSGLQTVAAEGPIDITGWDIHNGTAAKFFIQLFDAARPADITLGTTAAAYVLTVLAGSVYARTLTEGSRMKFERGFHYAVTTEDDNSTAPSYGTGGDTGNVGFLVARPDAPGR